MPNIDEIAKQLAGGLSLDQLRERQNAAANIAAKPKTPEQIEVEKQYWAKVFAEKPAKQGLMICRSTAQEMEYEDARRKFWAIMQIRAAHIATLENNPEFEWIIAPEFGAVLKNLVKYFINDCTSKFPLTKGLFVFGENGTGKTETMQAFAAFTEKYNLSKRFVFGSMSEVYSKARADKDFDPITPNEQHDRCFDEFGRTVGPVIRFGDALDINEAIIEARYNRFRRYGQITHFVANMAPNEAEAKLSPMIFDRLRSMCTSIEFTGKSKRV